MRTRRILSLLLAVLLVSALGMSARAELDEVEAAQYGVVRVYSEMGNEYWLGTAFAVGQEGTAPQYFVTNYHVVEENTEEVYITITDIDGLIPAKVLLTDAKWDLAILRIDKPLEDRHPLPIVPSKTLKKGETVYALGFPGQGDYSDKGNRLSSEIDDITVTKGSASKIDHVLDGVSHIYSDVTVNGGNSGGPMVNEHGHVVGVNCATLQGEEDRTAMSLAIHTEYVTTMLDSLNIQYEVAAPDGTVGGEKEEAGKSEEAAASEEDSEEGSILDEEWFRYGAIAAVAIVVMAVVLILVLQGKKKQPASSGYVSDNNGRDDYRGSNNRSRYEEARATEPVIRLNVRLEAGPMAGRVISGTERIYVGRNNPSCQISYPSGTPGVSKQHCCIEATPYGVQIVDMGSSYGTFVNGQIIQSHTPTNIGTSALIYIGSDKVVLSVRASNPGY